MSDEELERHQTAVDDLVERGVLIPVGAFEVEVISE